MNDTGTLNTEISPLSSFRKLHLVRKIVYFHQFNSA